MPGFADKVVMVTGAASGFGERLAHRLAGMGADLILGDVNEAGLARVADALRGQSHAVVAQGCDVTSAAAVADLVEAGVQRFARIDIGINNAGVASPMKSFVDLDEADLERSFAVNVKGTFLCMKYQLRQMLQQPAGTILNVASMAGLGGAPKLGAYAASKHVVVGLTRTAAVEYARRNIRVNAICPFYSLTPMVTESELSEKTEFLAQASPMKRLATADEIVSTMLMICAPDNTYLNGQAIAVDGGVSAY
jgi:NAD(P)-dependent dehydrogenase (short-subunit alcohol dehydrogenase family)